MIDMLTDYSRKYRRNKVIDIIVILMKNHLDIEKRCD